MKYSILYTNVELFSLNVTDDISRVKLSVQTHSTDDYINANYMPVSGERGSPCWLEEVLGAPPPSL